MAAEIMASASPITAAPPSTAVAPPDTPGTAPYLFHRHALVVRLTHWINAAAIIALIMTGLNIFNAHPALYWGKQGSDMDSGSRWLKIGSATAAGAPYGYLRIGSREFRTTGILGRSTAGNGQEQAIGYPAWATFPSYRDLGTARNFHFFFAWLLIVNGLAYLGYALASGHLRTSIVPRLRELRLSNIAHDIVQHARLRFPEGEDAKRYHILQKLAYAGVILVLIPLVIFTGLAMSPGTNAAWPWLLDLFGGRQSARSLHWIAMNLITLFIIVHLLMVVLAGPFNEIRSMITGKFRIDPEPRP